MKHSTRSWGPALKQVTFNWKAHNKYNKILNFETEVKTTFMAKINDICQDEKVPIIMSWLECKGLHFSMNKLDGHEIYKIRDDQ